MIFLVNTQNSFRGLTKYSQVKLAFAVDAVAQLSWKWSSCYHFTKYTNVWNLSCDNRSAFSISVLVYHLKSHPNANKRTVEIILSNYFRDISSVEWQYNSRKCHLLINQFSEYLKYIFNPQNTRKNNHHWPPLYCDEWIFQIL